jgi:adenylate cyclase
MLTDADHRLAEFDDLLEGLDGRLRAGRQRLLAELLDRGYDAASLREANRLDRLPVLLMEEALAQAASLSAREVASATGADPDDLLRVSRLLAIPVDDPDAPAFDELTGPAFEMLQAARAYLSQRAIEDILGVIGRHMWQLAADIEIIVGNELGRPGDTEYELAHRYEEAARVLAPAGVPVIASAFAAHLRGRMRDIFVTPEEAEFGTLRAETEVAVAFVDVAGFTNLGERVAAGELMSIATTLIAIAEEVVEAPVRIVKTVGDAILLMSRDAPALLSAVIRISSRAEESERVPPLHTGVAFGLAYAGGADVYGAPVNLASRLTDLAPPGRIWADAAMVRTSETASGQWAPRGRFEVKGFSRPVDVYELLS